MKTKEMKLLESAKNLKKSCYIYFFDLKKNTHFKAFLVNRLENINFMTKLAHLLGHHGVQS